MAESSGANEDYSGVAEHEGNGQKDGDHKPGLAKQESLVLYTQAALAGGKMSSGKGRTGRRPRTVLLEQVSEAPGLGSRRGLIKQQSETNTTVDNTGKKYVLSHQDTPDIIVSGDCDASDEDEDYDAPRTPLPVLPIVPPEPDPDDESQGQTSLQLSAFLGVTQRYRRSSLVRMDAVKQPSANMLDTGSDVPIRKLSVHGSLDLPKNTLKDLIGFRKAQSFNAESDDEDTVTISELNPSGKSYLLSVPSESHGKFKRKGPKKKKPRLRRLLTITTEPTLDREELEERHTCRKKEREERRKEKRERKLREKQKEEEEKYDEDGVRILYCFMPNQ